MPKTPELKRLTVYDIQRILCWAFNLAKRPSFLPLKASDRPSTINIIKLEETPESISKLLSKLKIEHIALVNERLPLNSIVECIQRDGGYDSIVPSLEYVRMENLKFIPMVRFEDICSSGIFVDDKRSLLEIDPSKYRRARIPSSYDIIALDIEKVKTQRGKDPGRITMVDSNGNAVYDKIIKPKEPILDYLTRYSGLTKEIIDKGIDVEVVRNEIFDFIGTNTVIVGHGIENDLSSLELYHNKIIDTAHLFLNPSGRKISLAQLAKIYLSKDIHAETHDSRIDATTCLELLSMKVQYMLRITDPESPKLKLQAKTKRRCILDILKHNRGYLNITACSYRDLAKSLRSYKKTKECLWMLIYEIDNNVYLSF
ncbi:putative RNA exonuclease [Encephalitozoon intestinalis ATCC 50506]|uniref:RNA exonuclease n=1 Tax=Encephalitozoon intestinalis (strain ATCC 50506) TaxID=876142 RepID=E0S7W1_ENCIT|nr:putative RNA exonuclease [Encephalitozoon intestinalis ATCC 50506]ADM11796.1 putative RNA exonuclease [Encephalitozoon intestinalis ATCC 50506]UTX45545.1 RNA exonuclease [Encephalitozoon intestinalis]